VIPFPIPLLGFVSTSGSVVTGQILLAGDQTDGDDELLLAGDETDGDDKLLNQETL
jgi:ligand-binding sensor protein